MHPPRIDSIPRGPVSQRSRRNLHAVLSILSHAYDLTLLSRELKVAGEARAADGVLRIVDWLYEAAHDLEGAVRSTVARVPLAPSQRIAVRSTKKAANKRGLGARAPRGLKRRSPP